MIACVVLATDGEGSRSKGPLGPMYSDIRKMSGAVVSWRERGVYDIPCHTRVVQLLHTSDRVDHDLDRIYHTDPNLPL